MLLIKPKLNINQFLRLSLIKFSTNTKQQIDYNFINKQTKGLSLVFKENGNPNEVLSIESYSRVCPLEDEVEIKMLCSPINPSDINQVEGTYPIKANLIPDLGYVAGNEGIGVIVKVGNQSDLKLGQWVVPKSSGLGTWRSFITLKSDQVLPLPLKENHNLSILSAATLAVNPSTAYRMLMDFKQLKKGDWLIQNGSNSGVGRMVIQLAKLKGIGTINIVRDRPEIEALRSDLISLGADYVITDSQLQDQTLLTKLKSFSPNLLLNCTNTRSVLTQTKLLANSSIIVTYGAMNKTPLTLPASLLIFKDLTFKGFWMTKWYQNNQQQNRLNMWEDLISLMENGKLNEPEVDKIEIKNEREKIQILGNKKKVLIF